MNKCPWCKTINTTVYIQVQTYSILVCSKCKLKYTKISSPDVNLKFNKSHYIKAYLKGYLANKSVHNRLLSNLKVIERYVKGGRLLDAGCGTGGLLKTIEYNSRYDWQLFGIDLNKYLVSVVSRSIKAEIRQSSLLEVNYPDKYFNCITCFDVLEHDIRIRENILNLRRMLRSDGIIVIQVPNYKSLMAYICGKRWDWWSPPDHVVHFSPDVLRMIISSVGLDIIKLYTYEPVSDYLSNIKGALFKGRKFRLLYYPLVPILILSHWIADTIGCGALIFCILKVKV